MKWIWWAERLMGVIKSLFNKNINLMKTYFHIENSSIWWKLFNHHGFDEIINKVKLINIITIKLSYEHLFIWWKFNIVRKMHHCDENILFAENNSMKWKHIEVMKWDKNSSMWWKSMTVKKKNIKYIIFMKTPWYQSLKWNLDHCDEDLLRSWKFIGVIKKIV